MFAWGIGDKDGATGETSGSGVERVVVWEGRLKHVPIFITNELGRKRYIYRKLGLTWENVELTVENHVHSVGENMPCMALRNIRVKI